MSLQDIINEQRTILVEQQTIREEFNELVHRLDAEFRREVQRIAQRLDATDGRIRRLTGGAEDLVPASKAAGREQKAPSPLPLSGDGGSSVRSAAPGTWSPPPLDAPNGCRAPSPSPPPAAPGATGPAARGSGMRSPSLRGSASAYEIRTSTGGGMNGAPRSTQTRPRSPFSGSPGTSRASAARPRAAKRSDAELASVRSSLTKAARSSSAGHGWEEPAEGKAKPPAIDQCEVLLRTAIEKSKEFRRFPNNPVQGLQQLFQRLDKNHSGKLDVSELQAMCRELNSGVDPAALPGLFARYDLDRSGRLTLDEFNRALFKLDSPGDLKAKSAIARMREVLSLRAGGYESLKAMGTQFRIIDRDRSGQLTKEEFEIALDILFSAYDVKFSQAEKNALFQRFDIDRTGSVSYDEFVRGVRGDMNDFRLGLVKQAFAILDLDGSGVVGTQEIARAYDVSQNPAVMSGKISPADAVREFMKHYDTNSDGRITMEEFVENYQWVSSSIDGDDYFELMMRNAWHMSGGEGWCANTANLRVLVQHNHGPDEVVEVIHDLGLPHDPAKRRQEVIRRLQQQGVRDIQAIEFTG